MSDSFVIRPAIDADIDLLPAIERSAGAAVREVSGLDWIADSDDITTADQHRQLMNSGVIFVAEDRNTKLVAFITCEIRSDYMHIWELDVHAEAQRAGLGRRLVQAAIDHACNSGLGEITLTTFGDVAFNAPFYEKLGFRIVAIENLGPRLSAIIENEVASGLPRERRCAMKMIL